jgi:hypothetical protein
MVGAMRKPANLMGQKFGMLTVVGEDRSNPGKRKWVLRCECGRSHTSTTNNLKAGDVTTCGCKTRHLRAAANLVHGNTGGGKRTKEYRAWAHIIGRCTNPNDSQYENYGGRGITISPAWVASFPQFLKDMGPAPSPAHSIDRIKNHLGYSPENCRWATHAQQARNTRRNIMVDGMCLKDACAKAGISYEAAQMRIRRGATVEQAMRGAK